MRRGSGRSGRAPGSREPPGAAGASPGADPRLPELAALLGREIELTAIVGEKRVPLGDLASAAPGADLVLLPRGAAVRLVAGEVEIGEGTAVETAGRLALRIDRLRPIAEIAAELGGALRAGGDGPPGSAALRRP